MADEKRKKPAAATAGRAEATAKAEETLATPVTVGGAPAQTLGQGMGCHIDGPVIVQGPPPPAAGDPVPPPVRIEPTGAVKVSLQRSTVDATPDQALWVAIRTRSRAIAFDKYQDFIERVLCREDRDPTETELLPAVPNARLTFGVDAYQLLKAATEAFLILRCGIILGEGGGPTANVNSSDRGAYDRAEEESRLGRGNLRFGRVLRLLQDYLSNNNLPYVDRILAGLTVEDADPTVDDTAETAFCGTLVEGRRYDPTLLELIWSYWHEEGTLVRAMTAVSARFQNKRFLGDRNALANLELHPLRPLSNLLWGYVQDEPFRLTVARRAYEYSHHYGVGLQGRAVPGAPADPRSRFLEAFHALLHEVAVFYKEDADTTVIANGFPLLNGLKEVHLLLAEGAHNQFGDLPWTARAEMLLQQWLLSRRELQEFLRGRAMVPYKEPWMRQVDTLRRFFGWGDTAVTHFRDLGVFGEQILLSIRYGDWIDVDREDHAKNWARYWKPEIQGYVHGYRAVTGVDLTTTDTRRQVNAVPPAILLRRRLARTGVR